MASRSLSCWYPCLCPALWHHSPSLLFFLSCFRSFGCRAMTAITAHDNER